MGLLRKTPAPPPPRSKSQIQRPAGQLRQCPGCAGYGTVRGVLPERECPRCDGYGYVPR